MKKIGLILTGGIVASIFTLVVLYGLGYLQKSQLIVEHTAPAALQANLVEQENTNSFSDFTTAAELATPAAVHIKSKRTIRTTYQYQHPFEEFFGDEFFKQFFGPMPQNPRSREDVQVATGSGVIIKSNGYIVTNNHVINEADEIEVTLNDNRTFKAEIIGTDPSTDLALIKIEEDNLPYLPFGNSDETKVGEWVLAVGNPFNLNSTVTAGIISAKARNIHILKDRYAIESFLQTDAAINPGNSGGALVNLRGELVGINTAIASPTGAYSGYGFAVPSNIVKKVIFDLEKYGVVQRGFIGIMIRDVDSKLAEEKGLKITKGVYVDSLVQNGAAEMAGIKENDVITHIDNIKVERSSELQGIVARHRPGDTILVKVFRKGNYKEIEVILTNRDGKTDIVKNDKTATLEKLGITIKDIPKNLQKEMNLNGGVMITDIKSGIIKDQTDIKEDFIITKIDKIKVKDSKQFKNIVESLSGGVMIEGLYEGSNKTYYYAFGVDK